MIWQPLDQISIPLPRADVKLIEDNFDSSVQRTGHGLQRAFIMTLLQHLALAQVQSTEASDGEDITEEAEVIKLPSQLPDLVLAIEEPELYQHPNRQRHLAKILLSLATGKTPGVADRTQVIYATHSPFFVGIDRFDQVRLMSKCDDVQDMPKITRVVYTSLDHIAEIIWNADGQKGSKYSGKTLIPRLQSIMTPWMSEGFFADVVLLVEGEDDRAAFLGVAQSMGHNLESMGISVIPCGGKTSIDRPAAIFRELGIATYIVWDSDNGDKDAKPEDNHKLLRLVGHEVTDWPSGVFDTFACFEKNLETTIRSELGQTEYDTWLSECQSNFRIPKKKHAMKNPMVISQILDMGKSNGKNTPTLESIVQKVIDLKQVIIAKPSVDG